MLGVDGNISIWGDLEGMGTFAGFFILIIVILTIVVILFIGCGIWCLYRCICVRRVELTVNDKTNDNRFVKGTPYV
jgi:hypothetical protein